MNQSIRNHPQIVMIDNKYFYIQGLSNFSKEKLNKIGYRVGFHKSLGYFLLENTDELKIISDLIDCGFAFQSDFKDIGGGPAGLLQLLVNQNKIKKNFIICGYAEDGLRFEEVAVENLKK